MPKKRKIVVTRGGIYLDWKTITVVVALLGNIGVMIWKAGELRSDFKHLQDSVTHQQQQLDEIERYFRRGP